MRWSMMVLGAALVGGCATTNNSAAGVTHLVCGSTIRLDISHDGSAATVRDSEGREFVLSRVPSDLGVRYAGQGISVLRSGDNYVYTDINNATLPCDRLQRE